MQQPSLFTLTFKGLIKQAVNRLGLVKNTRLPFIQNIFKKKNCWKYCHYLPRRKKKANKRYNNEDYTIAMITMEINEV